MKICGAVINSEQRFTTMSFIYRVLERYFNADRKNRSAGVVGAILAAEKDKRNINYIWSEEVGL